MPGPLRYVGSTWPTYLSPHPGFQYTLTARTRRLLLDIYLQQRVASPLLPRSKSVYSLSLGVEANPAVLQQLLLATVVNRLPLLNRHALTVLSGHAGSLPSSPSLLQVAKANAQDRFHSVSAVL